MTKFKITYMVDPGDGIESTAEVEFPTDNMGEVLVEWGNDNPFFVTKCEIIDHYLMVGG